LSPSPSGGLNDTPIQTNLQSQAKNFATQKGRSFSLPSAPHIFDILQKEFSTSSASGKEKTLECFVRRDKPLKILRIDAVLQPPPKANKG
jgi:hypothetical protein